MNMLTKWFQRTFADAQMVLLVAVLICLVLMITFFGHMLAPAIAALVIAFLLDGPIKWLTRKGARPMIAFLSVYIGFILIALTLMLAVVPPLANQITQFVNDTPAMIAAVQKALLSLQQQFPDLISETQVRTWFSSLGNELANLGPKILQYFLSAGTSVIALVVYTVLVPVMVFFFLKDKQKTLDWIASFLPSDKSLIEQVGKEVVERAGDYARGKIYEILIVGIASFIAYQFIGLRYATLLAVATGLSVVIPYFGATVVTLPVALVAYFQWGPTGDMVTAVVIYLILQALDGNLLAPLLFSEVVKLHPNAIILAILVFGGIWGLWGVFFAIPLATVANAVIRAWRERSTANSSVQAE